MTTSPFDTQHILFNKQRILFSQIVHTRIIPPVMGEMGSQNITSHGEIGPHNTTGYGGNGLA